MKRLCLTSSVSFLSIIHIILDFMGMVERIVDRRPKIGIYQVPRTHVLRSAGLSNWDNHGPEYILLPDGTVKFNGHFDDESPPATRNENAAFSSRIIVQLNKSYLFKKYIENILPYSDEAIELFIAIIEAAKKEFTGRFPGSDFHVIFWDYKPNHRDSKTIREELSSRGIKIHLISSILPDFNRQKEQYEISPYDLHPNALAQETIAQYVVDFILNESSGRMSKVIKSLDFLCYVLAAVVPLWRAKCVRCYVEIENFSLFDFSFVTP